MKKLALALALLFLPLQAQAQNVRQNVYSSFALYQWQQALTDGSLFGVPRYTTALLPACTAVQKGALVFDTTAVVFKACDGAAWAAVVVGGAVPGVGSCTNQFVTALNAGAAPTCTTDVLASAYHANQGTTTTLLHGNAAGNPSWAGVSLANDTAANQGSTTTLLHGNGAGQPAFSGVALADFVANLGTTTTVLHGNGAGQPTFGGVSLTADTSANQGTTTTLLHGNGAGQPAFSGVALADFVANLGTTTTVLHGNGAGQPTYGSVGINDVSASTGTGSFVFATSPALTTPTIADFTNATHTHLNAAGGGTLGGALFASSFSPTAVDTVSAGTTSLPLTIGYFGESSSLFGAFGWTKVDTNHHVFIETDSTNRSVSLIDKANVAFNYALANASTPTLKIFGVNQTTTHWIDFFHDDTNGGISTGLGALVLTPATGIVTITKSNNPILQINDTQASGHQYNLTSGQHSTGDFSIDENSGAAARISIVGATNASNGVTAGDVYFAGTQSGYGTLIPVATQKLTAGTMTVETLANLRTVTHSYTWTNAMVVALGGVTAGDVSVATLPAKTQVVDVQVVLLTTCGGVTTLTGAVGRVSASYIDYIVASDMKAAANTVYGDSSGERGTNLTGYDVPSYTATTAVNMHFISTGANLSAVTTCTGRVDLTTRTLP